VRSRFRFGATVTIKVSADTEDGTTLGRVFGRVYAPSTLGSFLRSFTFGHVRQLDASPPGS
jgi:hypothetical protein